MEGPRSWVPCSDPAYDTSGLVFHVKGSRSQVPGERSQVLGSTYESQVSEFQVLGPTFVVSLQNHDYLQQAKVFDYNACRQQNR